MQKILLYFVKIIVISIFLKIMFFQTILNNNLYQKHFVLGIVCKYRIYLRNKKIYIYKNINKIYVKTFKYFLTTAK